MRTEVLRLPAMEKKMDLLVVHLAQLLQAAGKTGSGFSAGKADCLKPVLEEDHRSGVWSPQPRAQNFFSSTAYHRRAIQRPPRTTATVFGTVGICLEFWPGFSATSNGATSILGENPDGWVRGAPLRHADNRRQRLQAALGDVGVQGPWCSRPRSGREFRLWASRKYQGCITHTSACGLVQYYQYDPKNRRKSPTNANGPTH